MGSGEIADQGDACARLAGCYGRLSSELCDAGDSGCRDRFRAPAGNDPSACHEQLMRVHEHAQPYLNNKPDFSLPAECQTGASR